MRLSPWTEAQPRRVVRARVRVETSDQPTSQVGSASARASQSRCGRTSTASSPPQGGITARTAGSRSIACSSAARSAAGALTTSAWGRAPSRSIRHSPSRTPKSLLRSAWTATSTRGPRATGTPLDGAVTPTRSPGCRGRGKRTLIRRCSQAAADARHLIPVEDPEWNGHGKRRRQPRAAAAVPPGGRQVR